MRVHLAAGIPVVLAGELKKIERVDVIRQKEVKTGLSDRITVQIAETRFAIRCDSPEFTGWLEKSVADFISSGEPHLRLNLTLNDMTRPESMIWFLDVRVPHTSTGEMDLDVTFAHPVEPYWPVLQICLRCAMAVKQPQDLLFHSSGVIHEGNAYLFSGRSGVGKSTVSKLLADDPAFTILHDDMVAISRDGARAWSTPLRGEVPAVCSTGAPLRAVFFLRQDTSNFAEKLSLRKAAGLLSISLVPPLVASNSRLVNQPGESVKLLFELASRVPCYELHFRPERNFWDCIPALFEEEPSPALSGG